MKDIATSRVNLGVRQAEPAPIIKYCLYARKSSESEERQVLSVDSQIKEMIQLAEREGLEIVEMERPPFFGPLPRRLSAL
jgi:hypothetical protein